MGVKGELSVERQIVVRSDWNNAAKFFLQCENLSDFDSKKKGQFADFNLFDKMQPFRYFSERHTVMRKGGHINDAYWIEKKKK